MSVRLRSSQNAEIVSTVKKMTEFRSTIRRLGFALKRLIKLAVRPEFRELERVTRADFQFFKAETEKMWRSQQTGPIGEKTVLVVSGGFVDAAKQELPFIIALRAAGYTPIVLMEGRNKWLEMYYRLFKVDRLVFWGDYLRSGETDPKLSQLKTFEDVLEYNFAETKVGKYAASTLMRSLRVGRFDPRNEETWPRLLASMRLGIQFANAASCILVDVSPDLALVVERGYSPFGQLFDRCLRNGIDTIQWCGSHKDNAHSLKRFTLENEHLHYSTLSDDSWAKVRQMPWSESHAKQLKEEFFRNYVSGQWYGEVGTQFNKRMRTRAEIQTDLKLDKGKKTAVIFSHLFWDATFFFGRDLFEDYEDWFVQTVRAAVENPSVNWIVKVHPANIVKNRRDGFEGELSEIRAIRTQIGDLPDHVRLMGAESHINTYSLFDLMDYCVTVRGTIGVEASSFGIPVLTAGTGRYDDLGFTIDSSSMEEYLQRLANIQEVQRLSREARELAQRYAYGVFLMRPFIMQSTSLEYVKDERASTRFTFEVDSVHDLVEAPDMRAFIDWACFSRAEDFLHEPSKREQN